MHRRFTDCRASRRCRRVTWYAARCSRPWARSLWPQWAHSRCARAGCATSRAGGARTVRVQTDLPGTFFSAPPGFGWLVILYIFVGGVAGGALLLAGLLRLMGTAEDRP